jgi:hypothetical protein
MMRGIHSLPLLTKQYWQVGHDFEFVTTIQEDSARNDDYIFFNLSKVYIRLVTMVIPNLVSYLSVNNLTLNHNNFSRYYTGDTTPGYSK